MDDEFLACVFISFLRAFREPNILGMRENRRLTYLLQIGVQRVVFKGDGQSFLIWCHKDLLSKSVSSVAQKESSDHCLQNIQILFVGAEVVKAGRLNDERESFCLRVIQKSAKDLLPHLALADILVAVAQ